jgi:hypothetical protein
MSRSATRCSNESTVSCETDPTANLAEPFAGAVRALPIK